MVAGALVLALTAAALGYALSGPAQAQRYRSGGFFQQLFGNPYYGGGGQQYEQQADYSHAPPPRKADPNAEAVVPTTSIIVMGDSMADWLAYGLEDVFADAPEVAIVRKNKERSGLLRYDVRSDLDWWHIAHDTLAQEKADFVVMMLGVSDRQNMSEKDVIKETEKKKNKDGKPVAGKTPGEKGATEKSATADAEDEPPSIVAPEPQGRRANGVIEFRSDQWAEIYSRRIDETIAALKSKGVPVFWVGLPSIRGAKSTADTVYLNDLFRARAERAGAIYVDIWDGFVDETGKFTTFGPDYEGQNRRLRSPDGVFFTEAGANKLARYIERELRRFMGNRSAPLALPASPLGPMRLDPKSASRPLAGPVIPLAAAPANSDELLGGATPRPAHSDPIADRVLVKGEPVPAAPGRADDFTWPRANPASAAAPVSLPVSTNAEPVNRTPAGVTDPKSGTQDKTVRIDNGRTKPAPTDDRRGRPSSVAGQPTLRPPGYPLGWFR